MKPNLIPNDYSRCSNEKCDKRMNCKRFLQFKIDKENLDNCPKSVCNFSEIDCEKHINNVLWKSV